MSNPLKTPLQEQRKAVFGSVLAGLSSLGVALSDSKLEPYEIVGILVAALTIYAGVFGVGNAASAEPEPDGHGGA